MTTTKQSLYTPEHCAAQMDHWYKIAEKRDGMPRMEALEKARYWKEEERRVMKEAKLAKMGKSTH
jgi:hypothetical protein